MLTEPTTARLGSLGLGVGSLLLRETLTKLVWVERHDTVTAKTKVFPIVFGTPGIHSSLSQEKCSCLITRASCWELSGRKGKRATLDTLAPDPTEQKPAWYEPFGLGASSGCQRRLDVPVSHLSLLPASS